MRFNQVEFGRRLKALRKERGMTQEELAAALSITPNHLGKTEMGKAMDAVSNERKSNEEKILDLIAKNGYVVRNDVDQLLDVSQTTASRILKRMVTNGLIYQDGRGRKTKYRKG